MAMKAVAADQRTKTREKVSVPEPEEAKTESTISSIKPRPAAGRMDIMKSTTFSGLSGVMEEIVKASMSIGIREVNRKNAVSAQ